MTKTSCHSFTRSSRKCVCVKVCAKCVWSALLNRHLLYRSSLVTAVFHIRLCNNWRLQRLKQHQRRLQGKYQWRNTGSFQLPLQVRLSKTHVVSYLFPSRSLGVVLWSYTGWWIIHTRSPTALWTKLPPLITSWLETIRPRRSFTCVSECWRSSTALPLWSSIWAISTCTKSPVGVPIWYVDHLLMRRHGVVAILVKPLKKKSFVQFHTILCDVTLRVCVVVWVWLIATIKSNFSSVLLTFNLQYLVGLLRTSSLSHWRPGQCL